jgi:predicted nucleic acid-binding protein
MLPDGKSGKPRCAVEAPTKGFATRVDESLVDCVIAATAQRYDAPLLTLNVRHFPMFKDLKPAF